MDSISNMLTSIRNAQAVLKETAEVAFSNQNYAIAKILEKEKFIAGAEKKGRKTKKIIEITLRYADKTPVISGLKRISKPGQRIYTPWKKIKKVRGGYGLAIISTSKGLMTAREARKQKIGGEVICEIW